MDISGEFCADPSMATDTPSPNASDFNLDLDTIFPVGSQEVQLPQPGDHYMGIDKETDNLFNAFLERFPAAHPSASA
jgi:hypothetical protein